MPTKYDVFSKIIKFSPCKAVDLGFNTPVYAHLNYLLGKCLIKKQGLEYVPVKSTFSLHIFKIIKYALKNGLDYNILLSKNISFVLNTLSNSSPYIRSKDLSSNKENTAIFLYLEKNQFLLVTEKKPRKGVLLKHQLLDEILTLNKFDILNHAKFDDVCEQVLKIKSDILNPFDEKIFYFLSGSAQLEGSTVTVGETRDLIVKGIYPDKPKIDIQMIQNLNEAMYFIFDNLNRDITVDSIKHLNRLVLFSLHRNSGNFKTTQNKIQDNSDFKTASFEKVPILIAEYCTLLNSISTKEECLNKLGWIHNELQRIHPFSDGNSRTTRMVVNWVLLKHNLPLLVLKMGSFDEYMYLTKLSKKRSDLSLKKLFCHLLLHENAIN